MASYLATVSMFDQARGVGEVKTEDGRGWRFHSTSITDASRVIEVGALVTVVVRPTHGGLLHAVEVTKIRV